MNCDMAANRLHGAAVSTPPVAETQIAVSKGTQQCVLNKPT